MYFNHIILNLKMVIWKNAESLDCFFHSQFSLFFIFLLHFCILDFFLNSIQGKVVYCVCVSVDMYCYMKWDKWYVMGGRMWDYYMHVSHLSHGYVHTSSSWNSGVLEFSGRTLNDLNGPGFHPLYVWGGKKIWYSIFLRWLQGNNSIKCVHLIMKI